MAAPDTDPEEEDSPVQTAAGDAVQTAAGGGVAAAGQAAASAASAPRVRVDARQLESALQTLRKRVAGVPLVFDIPGAEQAAAERTALLSQIDDYLLPRVRQSAAPILVALVGSTGAGKSTLVNSIIGAKVSLTGVRRPTTNSPVLACHPDEMGWFAENMFLPTMPRVRQEGLARPGRDGLLVLAGTEAMPKGIALLDTPDVDSVAASHREFAYQFLDASDLWLFMTSATRYADAAVWELLRHARTRGAALGVVLSRVPEAHRDELTAHFGAMLDANGITPTRRFVIPETTVTDGLLPEEVFAPVKDWMTSTARQEDRRVAVLTQTMAGTLGTFSARVPALAAHVDAQATFAGGLRRVTEAAYKAAHTEFDLAIQDGRLLGGEVLARWQDYTASGDLGAELRGRRLSRAARRAGKSGASARGAAYETALRSAVASLIVSVADRAAEQTARAWRAEPASASLLSVAEESRVRGTQADQEFESAFGAGGVAVGGGAAGADDQGEVPSAPGTGTGRADTGLASRAARAVTGWKEQLIKLAEVDESKRAGGGSLSLLVMTAMFAEGSERDDDIVATPRKLLTSVLGAVETRELIAWSRADLTERVQQILDQELRRFMTILDETGTVDPVAGVRLSEAEYALEAAR
ncbi:MAG TPA: GTPase [Trebonia sp.]|jgi:energy-coupling factor transporter ATP-binding protein EcfA2